MLAVVICSGANSALHNLDEHQPAELIHLGDRPILQHVIEYLIRMGATDLHLILSHLPEQIEAYFGDGTRWGCSLHYHLAANEDKVPRLVRTICDGVQDGIVVAKGWRVPAVDWPRQEPQQPFILADRSDERDFWSGWGQITTGYIREWFVDGAVSEVNRRILESGIAKIEIERWISADSADAILASQRLLLEGAVTAVELSGNQVEKGAWIGRNASIHPTAGLQPPFWIGPDCRIGARTRIGPYAVISERCIIDEDSSVEESMVTPGTYIGQGLELNQTIVDRNRLVNVRLDTTYLISDAFLAGRLEAKTKNIRIRWGEQILAIFLLVLLSPLWLLSRLMGLFSPRLRLSDQEFISTPASEDQRTWQTRYRRVWEPSTSHFWHEFLPGLPAAAMGRLGLTGVQPREAASLLALPRDWRSACLSCRPGLITEALTAYGSGAEAEELYSAEAYYAAVQSFRYNAGLLFRFAVKMITPSSPIGTHAPEE